MEAIRATKDGEAVIKRKNVFDDKWVCTTYDRWINGPTLFGHIMDRDMFYSFVIACVKYVKYKHPFVKKEEAWKSINMDTLKERLENDLAELRSHNYAAYEERLHEILVKFETLIEYEKRRYVKGLR